jgi:hypothetical protein
MSALLHQYTYSITKYLCSVFGCEPTVQGDVALSTASEYSTASCAVTHQIQPGVAPTVSLDR